MRRFAAAAVVATVALFPPPALAQTSPDEMRPSDGGAGRGGAPPMWIPPGSSGALKQSDPAPTPAPTPPAALAPAVAATPAAVATPAPPLPLAAPASVEAAGSVAELRADVRPRFFAAPFQLTARLSAGIEPHPSFACKSSASATCSVVAFAVGGEALWRGFVGFSLGLWASEGSPLIPDSGMQPGLGDRVSVSAALALRPFAPLAWKKGDRWLSRFLAGIGLEAGPSVEYIRTSSVPLPLPCTIGASALQPGFSGALHVEVPLLGDAKSGWLSLRVTERLIVNSEAKLAPSMNTDGSCSAAIDHSSVVGQTFFGLAFSI